MSVLVIGGDEIVSIKAVLHSLGCELITHWDARKESVNHKKIPQSTSCLILLTNFLNHNTMKKFRTEAKKRNIPTICSKRSASCVYGEFCKVFGTRCDGCELQGECQR